MFTSWRLVIHWITQSVLATIGAVPVFLLIGVANRNFGIQPEVTATIWMGGVAIGIAIWLMLNGRGSELISVSGKWITILVLSLIIGAYVNILFFQALATAPNPGLAMSVFNSNALMLFIVAQVLVALWPQFFPEWSFSLKQGSGVVLVIICLGLIVS